MHVGNNESDDDEMFRRNDETLLSGKLTVFSMTQIAQPEISEMHVNV